MHTLFRVLFLFIFENYQKRNLHYMTAMVKGSVFICLGMALLLFIVLHLHLLHQNYLPCGATSLTIPGLLTLQCYIPSLVQTGSVVLEKKMLTEDAQRRTPTNSSYDLGDLKIINIVLKSITLKK